MFKHNFESEKYLHNVLDDRHRTAIAKLRTSSHVLEIERGRHAKPKIATIFEPVLSVARLKMKSTS